MACYSKNMRDKQKSLTRGLELIRFMLYNKGRSFRREGLEVKNFFLGEYIKQRRLDLGLTQEQLCEGICEPMTLSRLENGRQTPGRNRINAILQRLGLPDDRYFALLSKHELEMEALQKEIVACNVTQRVEEGFQKIAQLEEIANPGDMIAKRFVLRSRVLLGRLDQRYTPQEQIDLLMQAIRMTVPRFTLDKIESFLYSVEEIKIINHIAISYSDNGQNEKAADIYDQLLRYVQTHFQEIITSVACLSLVFFNYARVLDLCGRYEEGAQRAKEGREVCIKYGHYQFLPDCLAIEAECQYFMGNREKSAELYHQAYYLCKVTNYQIGLELVKKEAKKYLNIEFKY